MAMARLKISDVLHVTELAKLSLDKKEGNYLTKQFNETLKEVDKLNNVKTINVLETSQVTNLKNVFREDLIDRKRMLSQKESLSGSKKIHNGYFVVKAILNEK